MGYDVRVSVQDRYLRIEASGLRSVSASKEFFRRVAEESEKHGIHDILLVLKLQGRLETFEIHDLVAGYREAGFGSEHLIAVVDENEESRPDTRFAGDVGNVRGLSGAVFENEEEAASWLHEKMASRDDG